MQIKDKPRKRNVFEAFFVLAPQFLFCEFGSSSKVGENVASFYNKPTKAFNTWLESARHKVNIEGDFTHIGVAIKKCETTGEKYYTAFFAKI